MAAAALIAGLVAVLSPAAAGAAPRVAPAPCGGVPQVTDASGDGHHGGTDVLRAWLSEASGHPQAVIEVRVGVWAPEHDDTDVNASGFALLFTVGGQIRYVRATAPPPLQAPIAYDYGTYTAAGGFVSAGATTGEVDHASPGTATIDVPAATGAVAGARLTDLFVLTYDGATGGVPHWVDHAPGGNLPTDPSVGADYVVGGCDPGTPPATTTAIGIQAPARVTGGGNVRITGAVVPARAGVKVSLTAQALRNTTRVVVTAKDGTFATTLPINETTRLRAVAEGVGSQTLTVTVRSTVHVYSVRRKYGVTRVVGVVRPAIPGRLLLIRTTEYRPSLTVKTSRRSFTFRVRYPRRGRYEVIFIPSGNRAERATSHAFTIKAAARSPRTTP